MKLSAKLVLSFGFIAALLLGLGAFSQYYNQQVKNQLVEESEKAIQELTYSGEMGLQLYRSLLNTQYFLDKRFSQSIQIDTTDYQMSAERAREVVITAIENFENNLNGARNLVDQPVNADQPSKQELSAVLQDIDRRFSIYRSLVEELFLLSGESHQDAREFMSVTVEPYFRSNLLPLIEDLRISSRMNMNAQISVLNSKLEFAGTILGIATLTALLISIGLVFYLYRSIATPLSRLSDTVNKIGQGNLDERISVNSEDEIGKLATEFNRMAENLSKITFSKDYVDNIIESMGDALVVTDENIRINRVNTAACSLLGYREEEMLGESLDLLFAVRDKPSYLDMSAKESVQNVETHYITSDGREIPVSFSKTVMYNADQSVKGFVCLASDISDRKAAEKQIKDSLKEKEILLAEIHHRVKNNLAVISGMLELQIWETEHQVAKGALRDSQLRVQSIALVHEKLYQSENLSYIEFDKYLRDLLQAISSTYMKEKKLISFDLDLEPVALNINQAIPFSLLVNELVVNAYKHAFNKNESGVISISLSDNKGKIRVRVSDDGSGFPDNFSNDNGDSLGMSIINTLTMQLNAEIDIYNDNGANINLNFDREEVV